MLIAAIIITALVIAFFIFMQQAKFGKAPSGKRLEQIKRSAAYRDGKFQNIHHTPALTEGHSILEALIEFIFKKNPAKYPPAEIPSVKTDLLHLPADAEILVWFGHSSYFIQTGGSTFLIDPVFSGNASPLPGTNKAFKGTDIYTADDLPKIDYLLITHDHYDHLDYKTVMQLKNKTRKIVCGLGAGAHFERWGFPESMIIEKDRYETVILDRGFTLHTAPTRHFSGRGFSRNNTLWLSFILEAPTKKIYIGGDSGYDTHFAEIGKMYGPFDLALLDNGQYDLKWKYIHMLPEEVLQAANDLQAKRLFPVHSSKFAMANHAWDDPLTKITMLNETMHIPLITPMIGEAVDLNDPGQKFTKWWEKLKN